MKEKMWEQVALEERKAVWMVYRAYLFKTEGWEITFEQCDIGWTGRRWAMIKYTFGIAENFNN